MENGIKSIFSKKKGMFIFIGLIAIFLFNIRNIMNLNALTILLDEFGYWAVGSELVGKDWSGVASSICSYYSYGYGILLGIIMLVVNKITVAYQVAIILNALMVCGVFLTLIKIFKSIFNKTKISFIILGCFIVCFLPNIIYQSQIAWTETYLMFLFTIILLNVFYIMEKPSNFKLITLASLSIYIYMVHQRSIGIVVLTIIFVLLLKYLKKITLKNLFWFFATILLFVIVHAYLKNSLYTELWCNTSNLNLESKNFDVSGRLSGNNFSGQIEKLKRMFSLEGIKFFVFGFAGKLFYFGITTFFIGYEGIIYLIRNIKEFICHIIHDQHNVSNQELLGVYIFLSWLFTSIIACVFLLIPGRIDVVIYGRYTDWVAAPLFLYGIFSLKIKGKYRVRQCGYVLFSVLFSLIFYTYVIQNNITRYFDSCAPMGYYFIKLLEGNSTMILLMTLVMIAISVVVFCLLELNDSKKKYLITTVIVLFFWIEFTSPAIAGIEKRASAAEYKEFSEKVVNMKSEEEVVYYVKKINGQADLYAGSIQFFLNEIPLYCVNVERLSELKNVLLIAPNGSEKKELNKMSLEKLYESKLYTLFRVR